jgi:hypothetical protein
MPTETDARPGPLPDAPAEEPKPKPKPAPKAVTVDVLERSITDLRDDMTRAMLEQRPAPAAGHPAVVHRSFADYADAVWHDASDPVLRRVLADQITTNNPGVIPPAWLSSVFGILDFGRPTITAFGVSGLPASGMELTWPYFDGDVMTLVGEQVVQKTAVTSVRVDLKKGSEAIRTFAGGSDISYQLIRRSDPSYRDAYLRIMMIAYAAVTNAAAAADAVAAATASAATWDPAAGTADALAEALFTASVEVESATGMPATFALAASDVFIAAGTAAVVNAANYGVQNVPGTASASTLAVSFAGLTLVHDGSLPAGTLLVSNGATAEWYEDGPFTVTAEDVEKLGQNVAVWGMGAFAVPLPAGIVSIGDGIP